MDKLFEKIYDENYTMIYRYFYYMTGNNHLSEDLTADTFLKAYRFLSGYDEKKAGIGTWLMIIAKNTYTDHMRKNKIQVYVGDDTLSDIPERDDPFSHVFSDERDKMLYAAIGKLKESERNLIAMKYSAELKNREIAKIIGKSERHTAVMLCRTLAKLKKILNEMGVYDYE